MTYEDLKVLREQKLGTAHRRRKEKTISSNNKLQTKRYLIMTYTVEFDQIHYPLPLTYIGKTDPKTLKSQIQELKVEIRNLKRNTHREEASGYRLDASYEKLLCENKEFKEALAECRQQLKEFGTTGNMSKELQVLKKVVQNLEVRFYLVMSCQIFSSVFQEFIRC